MKTIQINNKNIHIIQTAHVSKASVEEVKTAIDTLNPDVVCVELDVKRAHGLMSETKTEIDLKQIIKQKKVASFLMNLILSNTQKQMGEDLDTEVGGEMKQAILSANKHNIPVRYIDRDIQITMKRIWNQFGLFKKVNLGVTLFSSLFSSEKITEEEVENLKQSDLLLSAIDELDEQYPEISQVILHERNQYMAEKVNKLPYENILVVIGAAHAPGMIESLYEAHDLKALETIPEQKNSKWTGLIIPGTLLVLLTILTFQSPEMGLNQLIRWILLSSTLATLGALLSGAHIITMLVTFLTTWLSILSPVLAVGVFAALTESYFRPPYAHEFESLSTDIKSIKGWYKNRVLRIILIFFTTSLFSAIGTFISGKNIIQSFF
ncbi:MAG TPA: TraB/GumN family protein [Erysipelothrix sp.]|nr:TraB/GumN family protein [Erysipelothrix sp.]